VRSRRANLQVFDADGVIRVFRPRGVRVSYIERRRIQRRAVVDRARVDARRRRRRRAQTATRRRASARAEGATRAIGGADGRVRAAPSRDSFGFARCRDCD